MTVRSPILGAAGVFIMVSLFFIMLAALFAAGSIYYLPPLVAGIITAWIGFYALGIGLDIDRTNYEK